VALLGEAKAAAADGGGGGNADLVSAEADCKNGFDGQSRQSPPPAPDTTVSVGGYNVSLMMSMMYVAVGVC